MNLTRYYDVSIAVAATCAVSFVFLPMMAGCVYLTIKIALSCWSML